MKLLLFDIDGTILKTDGLGRRLIEDVFARLCGRPITAEQVSFSGKTDPQIVQEILLRNGFSASEAAQASEHVLNQTPSQASRRVIEWFRPPW